MAGVPVDQNQDILIPYFQINNVSGSRQFFELQRVR